MKTFDNLINESHLTLEEKSVVKLCISCNGIGSYEKEEMVDYHRNDYKTTRHVCKNCNGDGRVVEYTKMITLSPITDTERKPYDEHSGNKFEYFEYNSTTHRVKIDNRDRYREQKYPELAALTYEKYDTMLQEIKITEALEKYNDKKT